MKINSLFLLLLAISVAIVGCGKGKKGPNTVQIKGTLKIGGSAAPDQIQITLSPKDASAGLQVASAITAEGGKFALTTGRTGTPGAMKGEYVLVLRNLKGNDSYMTGGSNENASGSGPQKEGNGLFPEIYENAGTSDKVISITKKDLDFVLEVPGL